MANLYMVDHQQFLQTNLKILNLNTLNSLLTHTKISNTLQLTETY